MQRIFEYHLPNNPLAIYLSSKRERLWQHSFLFYHLRSKAIEKRIDDITSDPLRVSLAVKIMFVINSLAMIIGTYLLIIDNLSTATIGEPTSKNIATFFVVVGLIAYVSFTLLFSNPQNITPMQNLMLDVSGKKIWNMAKVSYYAFLKEESYVKFNSSPNRIQFVQKFPPKNLKEDDNQMGRMMEHINTTNHLGF